MTGTEMTTLYVAAFVVAVVGGGAILGWLVRAHLVGPVGNVDPVDQGEVGDPKHGD